MRAETETRPLAVSLKTRGQRRVLALPLLESWHLTVLLFGCLGLLIWGKWAVPNSAQSCNQGSLLVKLGGTVCGVT